jgi:hypothetical protein
MFAETMIEMKDKIISISRVAAIVIALKLIESANAGEIGHFNGGVMNIRDYVLPDPGVYAAIYNYFYTTDQLNNSNGDEIKSVIIKPGSGPGVTLGVNVDVNLYALAPTLIWVTDVKPLGMKYGALRVWLLDSPIARCGRVVSDD